jgi:hypothetical protein
VGPGEELSVFEGEAAGIAPFLGRGLDESIAGDAVEGLGFDEDFEVGDAREEDGINVFGGWDAARGLLFGDVLRGGDEQGGVALEFALHHEYGGLADQAVEQNEAEHGEEGDGDQGDEAIGDEEAVADAPEDDAEEASDDAEREPSAKDEGGDLGDGGSETQGKEYTGEREKEHSQEDFVQPVEFPPHGLPSDFAGDGSGHS